MQLPVRHLPRLHALGSVARVYPSVRHYLKTNRSPSIIGATAFTASTGATGAGVKVGVVDDGIDQTNPSFNASGFTYPAGFPKGQSAYTTPKVIVARSFLAAGATARSRLPVDPQASFHGTHVAGIAAGRAGIGSPGGRDHPPTTGLSGVAPNAWIGNYRVFNVPTPAGNISTTGQTVAAFEQAVKDGMDVINYSGGSPAIDPRTDAMIETVANVTRAGVVVVASAGNDRDDFGFGSTGSPSTAPEAIGVAATSNTHVFAPALAVNVPTAPASVRRIPFKPDALGAPSAWGQSDRSLVDVTVHHGDERPARPDPALRDRTRPERRHEPASPRLAGRLLRADHPRALHVPVEGAPRGRCGRRRAHRHRQPLRRGEPDPAGPAGSLRDDLGSRRRQRFARTSGRAAAARPSGSAPA